MADPTRSDDASRRNAPAVHGVATGLGPVRLIAGDSDSQSFASLSEVGNHLCRREHNPLDRSLI